MADAYSCFWLRFIISSAEIFRTEEGRLQVFSQNLSSVLILFVWILGLVVWFDNFGFNVTALLTVGIGGIAVGLAAQSILSDIFSSFTIALDKSSKLEILSLSMTLKGQLKM